MCGIVGMAGNLYAKDTKAFKDMLLVDSSRGEDSTGIVSVKKDKSCNILKKVGNPFNVFDHKQYSTVVSMASRIIIGHNRKATVGSVSEVTAHPFDMPNVVGVHNGTLKNKHALLDSGNFEVDSENLYHAISEQGVDTVIPKVRGAYALVWYDKEEDSLNFLRNDERPFHYAYNKAGDCLYWASESIQLSYALRHAGIEYEKIYVLPVDTLFSFDIKGTGKISAPERRELKGLPLFRSTHTTNYQKGTGTTLGGTNKWNKKTKNTVTPPASPAVTDLGTPLRLKATKTLFDRIGHSECSVCTSPLFEEEDVYRVGDNFSNILLCENCNREDTATKKLITHVPELTKH